MFKIFLKKKQNKKTSDDASNRRRSPRYKISNLTVSQDEEILLLKDLSTRGFSSAVSTRATEKFEKGQIYEARFKYHNENFDLKIKVAWKRNQLIGFEIVEAENAAIKAIASIIRPIALASSLHRVDSAHMKNADDKKIWYHGEQGIDLLLWKDQNEQVIRWQLLVNESFTRWDKVQGFSTGRILKETLKQVDFFDKSKEVEQVDDSTSSDRLRFAHDFMIAIDIEEQAEILATFS